MSTGNGVTLMTDIDTTNDIASKNIDVVIEFFGLYLKDKEKFYSLWVDEDPEVVTPYVSGDVGVLDVDTREGWAEVKTFWDPIFDQMEGRFDWYVDEFITGEDPNLIITRSHSDIDVQTGPAWGNKHVAYKARYVQIFRFVDGRVKSFEEYYNTAQLNEAYGG